jgi:hypothetical protein
MKMKRIPTTQPANTAKMRIINLYLQQSTKKMTVLTRKLLPLHIKIKQT